MGKPVLAVDCDDVVTEFNRAFITYMRETIKATVTYATHHSFDLTEMYGLPADEILKHLERFSHTRHHLIRPTWYAKEALQTLAITNEPQLVTSRCESITEITIDHLEQHVPNVFEKHHFGNGMPFKQSSRRRTKAEICHEIGAQVLIEDAISNAKEVASSGIPVLLFDRPWNQNFSYPNVTRVYSWPIVVNWINSNLV